LSYRGASLCIEEHEKQRKFVVWGVKTAKFSGLQAQVVPAARKNVLKRSLQPM